MATDPAVEAAEAGRFVADKRLVRRQQRRDHRPQHRGGDGEPYPPEADCYNIAGFCRRHGISQAMYYKLQKAKRGPKIMKVGSRTLISKESAAAWRAERTAATQEANTTA